MKWITFVGEGRSGHTIVSAILDSHPHIRISEEQKYISKWWREGWNKEKIIDHLLQSGMGKERRNKAFPGALKYTEPLLAMGDKCGWDAVNEFRKRKASKNIFNQFSLMMDMPVKIIHTSRHPLDNIYAWVDSPKYQRLYPDEYYRFRKMIRRYSRFYTALEEIIENQNVFHLQNEKLCYNSKETITNLMNFLEIECEDNWLNMVSSGVNKAPNKRSSGRILETKLYEMIYWRIIDKYPSLSIYKKENELG